MFIMEDAVPQNHILRLIDKALNFDFIYEFWEDKYSQNQGASKHRSCHADKNFPDSVSVRNPKHTADNKEN